MRKAGSLSAVAGLADCRFVEHTGLPYFLQDHYKLALGQINMCRNLIDRICQVGQCRQYKKP
jgi:hypothetical protein